MASQQLHYEVLTNVHENNMTTRSMRVSRNRENLQPYWIPEGFRAVLISINDIQRLPFQQATNHSQDIQQRQNANVVRRSRHANQNQTNPMARQGRCNTVLGAPLDQITVARAIPNKPKRKELSGNENDENSQTNTPTASASASASTSIGSSMVTAQAKKRCLGNKKIDARQQHNQNQRAAVNFRNNENKTPEHNISDPFADATTNGIAQTPSHNQRVSQRMSLSQQAIGSSNEFKHPRKAMVSSERDALYATHGSNRVSKNTSSMHINKPFRVLESKVESAVLPNSQHNLHSNPLAEDNFGLLSNEGRNANGDECRDEMESVELDRDQVMKM
ncbi:4586_t:CDS:1 [Paraglomus occultum]|uniref:4586_t:CDS:1 n=1 Tax=Paraglomus occultum TaxID=144539 RepID=A0A9N8Z4I4_9GLOM|nr:4586_t:CDS:1 [Paraglomus occultum]